MHCDWNQLWENRQRHHCCSPFKINTEKFSDPSSHGQSTFCFKLIGAAGWLWKLIFLRVPTDHDVATLWNWSETQQFYCTLLWSGCCGSLVKYGESTSLTETFLSSSISQNSQMCVIAAAPHPLQIHQTPLVILQILHRHFQMLHGIRESFHMTAVEGKVRGPLILHVDSSVRKWKKKKKLTDIVV